MSNLVYNKAKTDELVEEMKKKGHIVTLNDLSNMIRQSGLIIREKIRRKRSYIEVSPKMYGVNISQKQHDTQEFFKNHVKTGRISFIPDIYEKELTNVEGKARIARRRACIGYDEKYMTMADYEEFQKKFDVWTAEYYAIRDKIVAQWDTLIASFKKSLESSLKDLNSVDQEKLMETILSRIPTKDEYADSFEMRLQIEAFPVADNLAMFTPEIQSAMAETVNEEAVKAMYQMIGSNLDAIFSQCSRLIVSLRKDGKVNLRSVKMMSSIAKQIRKNNIIDNDKISELAERADGLGKLTDMGDIAVESDKLLLEAFAYAKELFITDSLSWLESPYTEKECEKMIAASSTSNSTQKASNSVSNKPKTATQAPAKPVAPNKPEKAVPEKAVNSLYTQISILINQALSSSGSIIQAIVDGKAINEQDLIGLTDIAVDIRKFNVLSDEKVAKTATLIENVALSKVNDIDGIAEKSEALVSYIYSYAKSVGIENDLDLSKTPYTKEELESLSNFLF